MRLLPLKRIRMVILQDKNQPAKEEEYYVHDVYEYAAIFMVCVWIGWRVVFVGVFDLFGVRVLACACTVAWGVRCC